MIGLNFAELLIPFMGGHKDLSYEIETSKKVDGGGLIMLILCFIWGLKNVLKHRGKLSKDAKDVSDYNVFENKTDKMGWMIKLIGYIKKND